MIDSCGTVHCNGWYESLRPHFATLSGIKPPTIANQVLPSNKLPKKSSVDNAKQVNGCIEVSLE